MNWLKGYRILVAALILSAGMNFALGIKINRLQTALQAAVKAAVKPTNSIVGMKVTSLPVITVNGQATALDLVHQDKPIVFYVFHPACTWCAANIENLRALSRAIDSRGTEQLIGLTLQKEGLAQYLAKEKLDFPIYVVPPSPVRTQMRLGGTPATVVVSKGTVLKAWEGAYMGDKVSEISEYFHVKLPGLLPISRPTPFVVGQAQR
jgi:hypothetical protein